MLHYKGLPTHIMSETNSKLRNYKLERTFVESKDGLVVYNTRTVSTYMYAAKKLIFDFLKIKLITMKSNADRK